MSCKELRERLMELNPFWASAHHFIGSDTTNFIHTPLYVCTIVRVLTFKVMTVQYTLYNVKRTMYILYNLLIVFNLRNVFAWICENLFCMFSFLFLKGTNDGRIFYFSVWRMINFCLPLYLVGTVGTVNLWISKTTFKKNVYLMLL